MKFLNINSNNLNNNVWWDFPIRQIEIIELSMAYIYMYVGNRLYFVNRANNDNCDK